VTFEVRDLAMETTIVEMPSQLFEVKNRLDTINVITSFFPFPLPHPGAYDVIVLVDGRATEQQRFTATLIEDFYMAQSPKRDGDKNGRTYSPADAAALARGKSITRSNAPVLVTHPGRVLNPPRPFRQKPQQ
jgi:hypothetical protein